jgi:hypothetical protein
LGVFVENWCKQFNAQAKPEWKDITYRAPIKRTEPSDYVVHLNVREFSKVIGASDKSRVEAYVGMIASQAGIQLPKYPLFFSRDDVTIWASDKEGARQLADAFANDLKENHPDKAFSNAAVVALHTDFDKLLGNGSSNSPDIDWEYYPVKPKGFGRVQ